MTYDKSLISFCLLLNIICFFSFFHQFNVSTSTLIHIFVAYKVGLCKSLKAGQKCTREPAVCAFCHSNDDSRHPRFRHRKATAQHGQNTQPKGSQQKPSVSSGRKNGTAAVGEKLPRPPSTVTTDYDDMSLPALKPISTSTTPPAHSAKHKNNGIGASDGWTQKQNGKTVQKSAEHVRQGGKGGGENDFGSVGKDATTTGTRVHSRDSKSKTNNSYSNSNTANHHQGFFAHSEEEDEVDVDDDDDDGFTTVGGHLKKNGKLKTGTTSNGGKKHHVETTATTATANVKHAAIATSQHPLAKMSSLQHDGDMVTTKTAAGVAPAAVAVAPAVSPSAFTVSTPVDAKIPVEYLCRLSKQLMNDTVICADGETYEKTVIEEWIQEHTKMKKKLISPVTGEEMPHPFLTPNFSIKTLIVAFRESTVSA